MSVGHAYLNSARMVVVWTSPSTSLEPVHGRKPDHATEQPEASQVREAKPAGERLGRGREGVCGHEGGQVLDVVRGENLRDAPHPGEATADGIVDPEFQK